MLPRWWPSPTCCRRPHPPGPRAHLGVPGDSRRTGERPASGVCSPAGMSHPCPRRWRVAHAAAVLALSVVGLGDVAEAFWLPPGFGPNQPNRVVAFGDSITAGVVGSACTNPDCLADAPY